MKHLIFHLNVYCIDGMISFYYRQNLSQMLSEIYGDRSAWFSAYDKVLADWDSYHADLNFSGDDGMADMREARFRIMRALFRIVGKPEPNQDEIHRLADKSIEMSYLTGDIFYHESHDLLPPLPDQYILCCV